MIRRGEINIEGLRQVDPSNVELCHRVWRILKCVLEKTVAVGVLLLRSSRITGFDARLRQAVYELYRELWGMDIPACLEQVADELVEDIHLKSMVERHRQVKTGSAEQRGVKRRLEGITAVQRGGYCN